MLTQLPRNANCLAGLGSKLSRIAALPSACTVALPRRARLPLTMLLAIVWVRARVREWTAPAQASAEVAAVMLIVTVAAKWSVLPRAPLLIWHSVDCEAVIAVSPCNASAIDARSHQDLLVTDSQYLHSRFCQCPQAAWYCAKESPAAREGRYETRRRLRHSNNDGDHDDNDANDHYREIG